MEHFFTDDDYDDDNRGGEALAYLIVTAGLIAGGLLSWFVSPWIAPSFLIGVLLAVWAHTVLDK